MANATLSKPAPVKATEPTVTATTGDPAEAPTIRVNAVLLVDLLKAMGKSPADLRKALVTLDAANPTPTTTWDDETILTETLKLVRAGKSRRDASVAIQQKVRESKKATIPSAAFAKFIEWSGIK